jgi:hypothetical protein
MSRKPASWFLTATAATLTALTALTAAPAWADPAPIGPNQSFYGEVNGYAGQGVLFVNCRGVLFPPPTGHPEPGQTVKVLPGPSPTSGGGVTGSAAHTIAVRFPDTASTTLILSDYGVPAPIPTSLTFPCNAGQGTVSFTPDPTSPTARTSTVTVLFFHGIL